MALIEFRDVKKSYNLPHKKESYQAVENMNLCIERGEFFGLLGQNGAGKTSLIQILGGINKASSGDVFVDGISVTKYPSLVKRSIGIVQQELIVDSFFELPELLNLQSKFFGVKPDKEWIDYLLETLMLKPHIKKTTRELSGGMKRRMMIARALVHKPKVLVLDEPTAGVDVELRHSLWDFVRELNQQNMTIILTTHYLEEAEALCHRIGIMRSGKLVALKTNEEIISMGGNQKVCFHLTTCENHVSVDVISQMLSPKGFLVEENNSSLNKTSTKTFTAICFLPPEKFGEIPHLMQIVQDMSAQQGFIVNSFETKKPTLEDVFIKINRGQIVV